MVMSSGTSRLDECSRLLLLQEVPQVMLTPSLRGLALVLLPACLQLELYGSLVLARVTPSKVPQSTPVAWPYLTQARGE